MSSPVSTPAENGPPSGVMAAPTAETFPKRCSTCRNRYPQDFLICPRDGTPLELEGEGKDPLLGRVLGDTFQIMKLVGEGGMGKVYEARHLRLKDRRFAVKVLHPEFSSNDEVVARFQREAESASSIDHPHVITVFDVSKTPDGTPYLVGEFLEGEELGKQVKRLGRLDVPMAAHVGRQVCRALAAAHEKGIVHRDMKPENVYVTMKDGVPHAKVLDFGISKAASAGGTNLTKTGMIMGTPSYMAPEQARGDKIDLRADIYAVGALLYQTLTGRAPFNEDDPAATLSLVLTEDPPRPRSITPSIPAEMELIVQRAMAKDPRDRFQTMAELDAALAPFDTLAGPSAAARPVTVAIQDKKQSGRDATANTMVAAVAATGTFPTSAKEAKLARPTIVLLTIAITLWAIGGFVAGVGGVVRYVRSLHVEVGGPPAELTEIESILVVIGTVLVAATPLVLFVARVRRFVWPNSVKSVELAADLTRMGTAAFVTYGVSAILARLVVTVFMHSSSMLANGLWDAALFAVSVMGAVIAGGVGPLGRLFRRRANT